jgi:hypothetical protein
MKLSTLDQGISDGPSDKRDGLRQQQLRRF